MSTWRNAAIGFYEDGFASVRWDQIVPWRRRLETSVRDAAGVIVTISVAGLASLHAQKAACSPAAATADPSPVDTAYPSVTRAVLIPSGDVRLNGVLYMAQGRGVHPTVVFLHGFPGDEKNLDLAQAVRRAGFNSLVFYYRGAWGSPGTYSYSHVLADVTATLTWLHEPAAFARGVQRRGAQLGALRGTSGEALSREAVTHSAEWSLQRYAAVLAKKKLLLLAASHDEAVPLSEVYEPLGAKLRAAGARDFTALTLQSDHTFSNVRIGLAQVLIGWLCGGT